MEMGDGDSDGGFGDGRQRLAEVVTETDLAINLASRDGVLRTGSGGSENKGDEEISRAPKGVGFGEGDEKWRLVDCSC